MKPYRALLLIMKVLTHQHSTPTQSAWPWWLTESKISIINTHQLFYFQCQNLTRIRTTFHNIYNTVFTIYLHYNSSKFYTDIHQLHSIINYMYIVSIISQYLPAFSAQFRCRRHPFLFVFYNYTTLNSSNALH